MIQKEHDEIPVKILFFDPDVMKIFAAKPAFERLAGDFGFSEGPVWMAAEGCLYFTDFPNEKIYRWDPRQETVLYTAALNRAIGLAVNGREQLVSCESRQHRIAIVNAYESRCIVDQYNGKRLNSPNDVIVAGNGDIYFTDPYSTALNLPSEQGFQGVYRVSAAGEISLVCGDIHRPNGLALSLDEEVLYVNDTDENVIYSFERNAAGQYVDKKEFARLDDSYGPGACDGMKVDRYGNIWVTGPAGIWLLNQAGSKLAIINCPEYVGNFCFGGDAYDELFITASTSVYRMKLAQRIK